MDSTWLIAVLLGAVAVLIQWWMRRIEADIRSGREATEKRIDDGLASTRNDLNGLGDRFRAHELRVANEYVSFARLTEAMAPLRDGVDGLKNDLARLFEKLDKKVDKTDCNGCD